MNGVTENCLLLLRTLFSMVILLLCTICFGLLKTQVIENHLRQERRGRKKLGRSILEILKKNVQPIESISSYSHRVAGFNQGFRHNTTSLLPGQSAVQSTCTHIITGYTNTQK